MNAIQKHILKIGLLLALFAIGATSLVVITEQATRQKIIDNEREALLSALNALVPAEKYNNDILLDTLIVPESYLLSTTEPTAAYRARMDNKPVAIVFTSVAPNGYNGKIKLLIGVKHDGILAGVRVISHKETPGLGDKIDERKANWIHQFKDLSLMNPDSSKWHVKRDGGEFDQFTGATITPRAVIAAVKNALHYFERHQEQLFQASELTTAHD